MLEGNELEGKIGEIGSYSVDVDTQGGVKISVVAGKDLGHTKVSSVNSVETNIFKLAEEITKKTQATWDDKALAMLKNALGIK